MWRLYLGVYSTFCESSFKNFCLVVHFPNTWKSQSRKRVRKKQPCRRLKSLSIPSLWKESKLKLVADNKSRPEWSVIVVQVYVYIVCPGITFPHWSVENKDWSWAAQEPCLSSVGHKNKWQLLEATSQEAVLVWQTPIFLQNVSGTSCMHLSVWSS